MKNAPKIVLLVIAGLCFMVITWFTFVDPKMTIDQFMNLVYAGMILVAFICFLYVWYTLKNKS